MPRQATATADPETATPDPKTKARGPRKGKPMSDDHKKALAEGREQGRKVNAYLDALDEHKPKRGRKVTAETIRERIAKVDEKLPSASASERLRLFQEKIDLEAQLRRQEATTDFSDLEKEFVKVAKDYAERKGITYTAFVQAGVPASVLKEAGLERRAS